MRNSFLVCSLLMACSHPLNQRLEFNTHALGKYHKLIRGESKRQIYVTYLELHAEEGPNAIFLVEGLGEKCELQTETLLASPDGAFEMSELTGFKIGTDYPLLMVATGKDLCLFQRYSNAIVGKLNYTIRKDYIIQVR